MLELWYNLLDLLPFEIFHWTFMKHALLAVILLAPLFGLMSTMIITGKMSFFSDALGHSAFTGIAIGCICGIAAPTWVAILFSIIFALLFSFVRSRSNNTADTLIGVFSSTAVALGIFIATLSGSSFTKYNRYLIGDILSVTPTQISVLLLVLLTVFAIWVLFSNHMILVSIHPQLSSSRGIKIWHVQALFTVMIAVVVTLAISWVGLLILNSLLVLPGASARNISKNLRQYHCISIIFALFSGIGGLCISYHFGASAGATISLLLALCFAFSFCFRKVGD